MAPRSRGRKGDDALVRRVIDFWFGRPESADFGKPREEWFRPPPGFDAAVSRTLGADFEAAAAGRLEGLTASAEGCLALVVLLDQFPGNAFRGTFRAFATDPEARRIADHALGRGFDRVLVKVQRLFLYMPFEHSEAPADQDRAVTLIGALDDPGWQEYAVRHRDIVARFGRFPHRNAILGRQSTPAELTFLKEPGSSF